MELNAAYFQQNVFNTHLLYMEMRCQVFYQIVSSNPELHIYLEIYSSYTQKKKNSQLYSRRFHLERMLALWQTKLRCNKQAKQIKLN